MKKVAYDAVKLVELRKQFVDCFDVINQNMVELKSNKVQDAADTMIELFHFVATKPVPKSVLFEVQSVINYCAPYVLQAKEAKEDEDTPCHLRVL